MNKKIQKFSAYFLSVFILFLIWCIVAKIINAPLILPAPQHVIKSLNQIVKSKQFWIFFKATFIRVLISFIFTIFSGFLLGLLCSYSNYFNWFLQIPLSIVRTVPVIAIILVALFWFNSSQVPVFVSVLMTLPIMISSTYTGFSQKDLKINQMAQLYELSSFQKFKYIKMKKAEPYLFNGAISCFGLSWKVVVAGEVLSLPVFGLGSLMQKAQVHLEPSDMLSITFVLIFISFTLEQILRFIFRRFYGKNFSPAEF